MEMSNYGLLSLIPIIITIVVAMKYKNILIALLLGSFSGVLVINNYNPFTALKNLTGDYIIPTMGDSWNAKILLLLVVITGFVKLLEVSGGTQAFARSTTKSIDTKNKAQVAAWFGGIAVFFTDVGSPLVVGPVFRPIFDKLKISREKLAWIADTTASPVSVLIPFLGWGAYIMGLMAKELPGEDMLPILLASIPFNFYAVLSILFVPFVIFTGRELKAMARAEARARKGIIHPEDAKAVEIVKAREIPNANVWVMVVPILVFIASLVLLQPKGFPFAEGSASGIELSLIIATIYASVTSITMMKVFKIKTLSESIDAFYKGLIESAGIIIILVLAWVLGGVGKALGAPNYIVSVATGSLPVWAMPAVIFLTGAFISFATGSSWGTFSIMMTLAIPLALELDSSLVAVVLAAVLSGGLFGDHCSPISDTTILSGTGSGCDLVAHVRTQLPYALFVGTAALVCFILAAVTGSVIILPVGIAVLYGSFIMISSKPGMAIPGESNEVGAGVDDGKKTE